MLHPLIQVRESAIAGRGLFATGFIAKGEIVWECDPSEKHYHISEIKTWPKEKQDYFFSCTYQVGPDTYYGMDGTDPDDADFMNHSCEPNTWFISDTVMLARGDIKLDDEITYDYVTSETREDFNLDCQCGSALCRGKVSRNNLIESRALREVYAGRLMRHVQDFLDRVLKNI